MTEHRLIARPIGPWFRQRPKWAVAVAACLYLTVGTCSVWLVDDRAAIAVALVLPVSLLAVTFGRRGGLIGSAAAVSLYAVWFLESGGSGPGTAGWASGATLLLLGALLGEAIEDLMVSEQRVRLAEGARWQAEQNGRRQREAMEISDTIVQHVAVAKWALEAGKGERALELLDEVVDHGQQIISALLTDAPLVSSSSTSSRSIRSNGLSRS